MQYRRIKPAEHVQYTAIRSNVFYVNKREDVRKMFTNPMDYSYTTPGVRIGAFENGDRLVSAVRIIPFTIRMNDRNVKMGGIASVVSRPESRSKGNIRRLMEMAFEEMNEAGQVFSFLHPFSHEYYRKFGYELCYTRTVATVPIRFFDYFPYPENAKEHEPGDPFTPFADVYKSFTNGRNLSVVRNDEDWKDLLDRDPYKNLEFTYLFRDGAGKAEAYALYKAEKTDAGYCLNVKEYCWSTPTGLNRVFAFFGKLSPEADEVRLEVPDGVNLHTLFRECKEIITTQRGDGMNRLVNVSAGLGCLRAPNGGGKIKIGVCDSFWHTNTGLYSVEWEGGNISVAKLPGGADTPDMETNVETLAQLVTGYLTPEEAVYKKGVTVYSGLQELRAIFPKRNLYLTEQF